MGSVLILPSLLWTCKTRPRGRSGRCAASCRCLLTACDGTASTGLATPGVPWRARAAWHSCGRHDVSAEKGCMALSRGRGQGLGHQRPQSGLLLACKGRRILWAGGPSGGSPNSPRNAPVATSNRTSEQNPINWYLLGEILLSLAEADGNRTRRGTLVPPLVLKTREPTRRSFASASEVTSLPPRAPDGRGKHMVCGDELRVRLEGQIADRLPHIEATLPGPAR